MKKDTVNSLVRQRLVHEIHTSERKSFRGCRRRWDWIFRQYYYPRVTAKPLEFGIAFHKAMETLYNPDTWKFDRDIVLNKAIMVFADTCEAQRAKFLEVKDQVDLGDEEAQLDYDARIELGKGMLTYYAKEIAPVQDVKWTPLHVEVEFIVPIQNPDTDEYLICKCPSCWKLWCEKKPDSWDQDKSNWEGLPVCLAGRIDMLAEDKLGNYWIVDWKTAASIASESQGTEFLALDDQISSYVMALRRKLGINVRGFLYIEMKKAFPEAPKQNKSTRLGRKFSVALNQATDYGMYLKTIQEHDLEAFNAGLYDDFLKYLQEEGTVFHQRYQILKTDTELEQIERTLFYEASDMIDQQLRIYPNPGRFNCGFCAFRQPCLEQNSGGDYQYALDELYDKRSKHYWVKELSTDKRGGE